MKHQGLEIVIKDGLLLISIGTETLARAVDIPGYSVKCSDGLALDIKRALKEELCDGTTPVHRFFDSAALVAVENGSDALEEFDGDKGKQ